MARFLNKPAELTLTIVEHTVFSSQYDDVLNSALKHRRDIPYLFDTAPCHALANYVDEALKEKPGGGALDEEHEETHSGSGGALPISGGEPEALPEAVVTVIAKTGATEGETMKMDAFVAQ